MQGRDSKVLLIGLDGATYDLVDQLVEEGVMPEFGRLMDGGARAILRSTMHPLTPPAWATVMTGRTPGNHGIFDFIRIDREAEVPSYTLATSADLKARTLWEIASAQGMRAMALNFPVTFPARPIDGVIIPGYVPWSYLGRAIHPRESFKRLKERGVLKPKEMSTDWQHERKAVQGLAENQLSEWVRFHIARERRWFEILMTLMEDEPCDLTAVLFDGVDRIQHLCYHLIDRTTRGDYPGADAAEASSLALRYFSDLDGYIARIVERAGPGAQTFVVSDHGFTRAGNRIFYANTWLEQQGLLRWRADVPIDDQGRLALDENTEASTLIDWEGTSAYALTSSSNAIFIRRASSPHGAGVPADQYEAFRARLIAGLKQITDPETGERVVEEAWTQEEAFAGAFCDMAPDITLKLRDYSFLSVLRADEPLKDRRVPYATHHPDGIFVAFGQGIARKRMGPLDITDIAPTVCHAMGSPVPAEMDGDVATEAFTSDWLAQHPVGIGAVSEIEERAGDEVLPDEAQAQIRERLKSLGYL